MVDMVIYNEKEIYEIAYRGVKNALYAREQEQNNAEKSFPWIQK